MDTYTSNEDGLLGRRRRINLWEKSIISSQRLAFEEAIADYLPSPLINLIFEEVKNNMRKKLCPKCSTRTADFESCERALCSDIWCRPCTIANAPNDKARFAECRYCGHLRCKSHYRWCIKSGDIEKHKFSKATEESSCKECGAAHCQIPGCSVRSYMLLPYWYSDVWYWYCHAHREEKIQSDCS
jgi:hypothetical protein